MMDKTTLLDAHLHRVHAPQTHYPPEWTYLSCATGPVNWFEVLEDHGPSIYPFLGIHPETGNENKKPYPLEKLEQLLIDHDYAGVGEIGIDRRYYPSFPRSEQEALLRNQLMLAAKYDRPVILHQVRTLGTLLEQLGTLPDKVPMLIHGFRGNQDQVRQINGKGLYISIGPGVQWEKDSFKQAVRLIPRQRLLLESDWPYQRTSPSSSYQEMMESHYGITADATGIDREELIRIVHTNGQVFTDRQINRKRTT